MSFFDELKRRNVFRVGAAYLVVAWLILQVVDVVGPMLGLPESFGRGVLLLLAIGFPAAVILSWAFELTPEGVKKEQDVDRSESTERFISHKFNTVIIAVMSLALLFFFVERSVWDGFFIDDEPTKIAVLPFVNLSDDPDQEYFSDGLSEELLNLLNRIPQLTVTSRTSAFSFKGKDFTIAEVGEQLGVSHVLQGSVRRSGDTLRISAQLIDVVSDSHSWSDSYERELEEIFTIQDEIAAQVVDALKLKLLSEIPKTEETAPEVYTLVLEAAYMRRQGNAPSVTRAIELLEQAIEIDPEYSPAWSQLGSAHYFGTSRGISEKVDVIPLVNNAIDTALRLNAANVDAYLLRAQVAMSFTYDFQLAARALARAEGLEPWNSSAQRSMAYWASATGNLQVAVEYLRRAHELDPLAGWLESGASTLFFAGHIQEALGLFEQRAMSRPFGDRVYSDWARAVLLTGDPQAALALLDNEASVGHRTTNRALVYQSMGETEKARDELEKLLALGNRWTFEIAEVYAYVGDANEAFAWLDRAVDRQDSSLGSTVYNPFLEPIRDDPRYDELLERLGRKQVL